MATGSFPVMVKNAKQFVPGMGAYFSNFTANMGLLKKYKDRQWNFAPQTHKDQKEDWDTGYWKRGFTQEHNMWVDKEIDAELTRKDLANLMTFKVDSWKVGAWLAPTALTGGYGLAVAPFWLGNDTWQPSTMPQTPEALAQWREAQDLYRYKYAPASITAFKFWIDTVAPLPEKYHAGWEDLFEKNDVRRNAAAIAGVHRMYECIQPFKFMRRQQGRMIGRAMGIPTFPTWSKICMHARIRDYWELAFNEDHLVIKNKLVDTMSDEELYDYAWRRYLAPYDKKLTREQLVQRVEDYHVVLGPNFLEKGEATNVFLLTAYCFGYYNEPAFLDGNIADLDSNDFEGMSQWTKDAYMQRLEFENGPLRDQVEAWSQKKLAEREAKLKAVE